MSANKYIIVVDYERCTFCGECELVCSLVTEGESNPAKSKIRIAKWESLGLAIPMVCRQCFKAPCAAVCPVKAIVEDPKYGYLKVNKSVCIGCGLCAMVCPFGAMKLSLEKRMAVKCDLCEGNAYCVKFCPTKAIEFMPVQKAFVEKELKAAERLQELLSKFAYPSAKEG